MEAENRQHILIIEDDGDIGRLVCLVLEKEGFAAKLAVNAGEALRCLSDHHPDLIICDVMLPEISGLEFTQQIKADPATAEIPIMMMSALTDDGDVLRGQSAGAEYYLSKPFERTQLLAAVKGVFATVHMKRKLNQS